MTLYNPNIPQDLPPGTVIVDEIRANFSQYAMVFDNNHEPLNNSNQGKHTNVLLQQQSTEPVVNGSFDAFYSAEVTSNSSVSEELFVKIPQFLPPQFPNDPMQLTFNSVNTVGPNYQSFIAGGYIVFFGTVLGPTNTITLSPKPKKIVCAIANGNFFALDVAVLVNANNFQFTITSALATGANPLSWFCIGTQ